MYNVYKVLSKDGLNRITGWIVQTPEWNKKIAETMGEVYELEKEGFPDRNSANVYAESWFPTLELFAVFKVGYTRQQVLDNGMVVMRPEKYRDAPLSKYSNHELILEGFRFESDAQKYCIQWYKDFEADKIVLSPTCSSARAVNTERTMYSKGKPYWLFDCPNAHGFIVSKEEFPV